MTSFPAPSLSRRTVLIDPATAAVLRVIALQYTRRRSRTLRSRPSATTATGPGVAVKAPPLETSLDAERRHRPARAARPEPHLRDLRDPAAAGALETIVYPPSARLQANNALARAGTLEIAPVESPLILFVWSRFRIVPVRITELSITEEAFDPKLNPIRAKVSLGLRVLSVNDLGFDHKGGSLNM